MELADKIDPAEVLSHLNHMGYRNITPLQLKEFVRDLKKLIIYDRLTSSSSSLSSLSSSITSCSEYYSSPESPSNNSNGHIGGFQDTKQSLAHKSDSKDKNDKERKQCDGDVSSTSYHPGSAMRRSSSSSSVLTARVPLKEKNSLRRGRTKSTSEENLSEVMKPKTSFIRPWQLQGVPSTSVRSGSNDPVALYHYYQTLWSKRKCPGEDSHADLRWIIREKMLGQDPHLYSKSISGNKSSRLRM